MELTLSNPWGLLGLLAIPVVIAIHFLQRRSRSHVISTLFLVPVNPMEARSGSRLQFWRNSASFWMQILAVLLLTWILAQPRWIAADFRQRVVVIYDSSVSMQAFEAEVDAGLAAVVDELERMSRRNEWILLPSILREGVIYRGVDAGVFLEEAKRYRPAAGQHSLEEVFRFASEIGSEGQQRVIFLTDHIPESLPESVELYAVGRPLDNVGFSGLRVESREGLPMWRASVRNYGSQAVRLQWQLSAGDAMPVTANLELPARSTKVLTSRFPEDADLAVTLQLPDDAFAPDNRITVYQPKRKEIRHALSGSTEFAETLWPVVESVAGTSLSAAPDGAHFIWASNFNRAGVTLDAPFTVQFAQQSAEDPKRVQGFYAVESDPLMDGLSWNSLVYRPPDEQIALGENERALLWHDETPLISIRDRVDGRDLFFNFDPLRSNALRLPGFLILLNRFVAEGEATLPLGYRENFEGNQSLGLERLRLDRSDQIELRDLATAEAATQIPVGHVVRAPIMATTLEATLNGEPLLAASVFFAETTEADLSAAASSDKLAEKNRELIENNSREDFLTPVWLILLAVALLLNWYFCSKGR